MPASAGHSKRTSNALLGDGRFGHRYEGLSFVATAFTVDHENANQILLGINEAVGPIAPSVAVAPRRKQCQGTRAVLDDKPAQSPADTGLAGREIACVDSRHEFY